MQYQFGEMEYDAVAERQAMFDHVCLRTKGFIRLILALIGTLMKTEYENNPYIGNMWSLQKCFLKC
jgi:hypothetical protein